MSVQRPSFVDSPYFVMGDDGWYLLPGAPPEVVQEFEEFMKYHKDMEDKGIDI